MLVLVVNAGSSSLKYQLVDTESETVWAAGLVERIGETTSTVTHRTRVRAGAEAPLEVHERSGVVADHAAAFAAVDALFAETGSVEEVGPLVGVGHRVVQGGDQFVEPTVVDAEVIEVVRSLNPLAPLHNPACVAGLESAMAAHPEVPHVAIFDTAFHATIPPAAYTYAIDRTVAREHRIRRYGFHGTSHKYVTARAAQMLGKPVEAVDLVTLHLGNGASACAVRGGRSIETSMGLTPLEGLVMGTRSGDLDPAIAFHLITTAGMTAAEVDAMLNKRSGLVGLCGQNDLREVHRLAAAGDPDAELALGVYVHRIRKYVGAYLAVIGRADAIVFTAGVGENDPEIRRRVVAGMEMAGIAIDTELNAATRGPAKPVDLSFRGAPIRVLVVPTNEELEIARQTAAAVS
ncbi:MAG: acetate kinase [Candidatus Nanopelagicales bacterium]|jgi:acetate kinase|nr:acetate kinase [Candidatus Nanopelagicales bacterium]